MTGRLSRAQVAERLGVKPITIYRWEKRNISPVTPKRIIRTKELIYSEDDIPIYEAWMNATEPANIGAPA